MFCVLHVQAQNIEGQPIASQYGSWTVQGYAPNTYTGFSPTACRVQGGASFFNAFTAGVPIKIVDGNPNLTEVVTPTAVTITNQSCSITIAPANNHQLPFYLTSATGGLQEALNANATTPDTNTVVLDNRFYQLAGGATNAAAVIASVQGSSNLGLEDVTQVPTVWYAWNGTQYTGISVGGNYLPLSAGAGFPLTGDLYLQSNTAFAKNLSALNQISLGNGSNSGGMLLAGVTGILGQAPTIVDSGNSLKWGGPYLHTVTGDLSGSAGGTQSDSIAVVGLNGQRLASLASGPLWNTTTTGVPSIATSAELVNALNAGPTSTLATGLIPTLNYLPLSGGTLSGGLTAPTLALSGLSADSGQCVQITTGGALTNTGTACGSGGGGGLTALTQDVSASGTGSQPATVVGINNTLLSGLASGPLWNTTATGAPSIATSSELVGVLNASPSSTLAPALLPNPTASTLGGIKSLAAVSHEWINAISTGGAPSATQPAFSDISGTAVASQLPVATTSALGVVKPDGTSITISGGGTISAAAVPGGTTGAVQYNNGSGLGGLNGTGLVMENGASAPTIATAAQVAAALTSTIPGPINITGTPNDVCDGASPTLCAPVFGSGAPSSTSFNAGSFYVNPSGGIGSLAYSYAPSGFATAQGATSEGSPAANVLQYIQSNRIYVTAFTTGSNSAGYNAPACSMYLGYASGAGSSTAICGILAAPTSSTTGTSWLCYGTYALAGNTAYNTTVTVAMVGCPTLTTNTQYWAATSTTNTSGLSSATYNCGSSCSGAAGTPTGPSYFEASTLGVPPTGFAGSLTTVGAWRVVQSISTVPILSTWLPVAYTGGDIGPSNQVQGINGTNLAGLGAGVLGLDNSGNPRIMSPSIEATIDTAGIYGNNTDFLSGQQIMATVARNPGHFTSLTSINTFHSSCGTAPTFNVFDASSSNLGIAKIASATLQSTTGSVTTQAETLPFAAGDVIGIIVSTQGTSCASDFFAVSAQYSEP